MRDLIYDLGERTDMEMAVRVTIGAITALPSETEIGARRVIARLFRFAADLVEEEITIQ